MLHNHNSMMGNSRNHDYAKFTVSLGHGSIERHNEYGTVSISVKSLPDTTDSFAEEIMSRLDLVPATWINNRRRHDIMIYGLGLVCDCCECTKEVYITSRQLMGLGYRAR